MKLKFEHTASSRGLVTKLVLMAQAVLLSLGASVASAQEGNQLQDIQVQSLPGNRVELTLVMSDTAPEPLAFTIDSPARSPNSARRTR